MCPSRLSPRPTAARVSLDGPSELVAPGRAPLQVEVARPRPARHQPRVLALVAFGVEDPKPDLARRDLAPQAQAHAAAPSWDRQVVPPALGMAGERVRLDGLYGA